MVGGHSGPRYKIANWVVTDRANSPRTNCTIEAYNNLLGVSSCVWALISFYKKLSITYVQKNVGQDGPKLASRLFTVLCEEESRVTKALPAFYVNPQFQIGRPPCAHTKKREDLIARCLLNVNNFNGVRFLDYISNLVGKYRKWKSLIHKLFSCLFLFMFFVT